MENNKTCMIKTFFYDEEGVEGIECEECGWTEIYCHDDVMPDRCPQCNREVEDGN